MTKLNTSDAELEDHVSGDGIILVDIWANWCGPCRQLSPVLEQWAEDTGNTVLMLDADKNSQTMIDNQVMSVPTILVYKDGEQRGKLVGARSYAKLVKDLEEILVEND